MPRRVVIVALPEVQPLDVTGPAEVFASAASVAGGDVAAYTIEVVAPGGAPIPTDSGYAIAPAGALEAVRGPIDTLLVAGGAGARNASPETVARVRRLAARADRVASVCTGAYVLAAAGLLDGRRATTHWSWCDDLDRVGRVVAARDGRGGGEDLGRPGDVERLDLGQGDDDDAPGHGDGGSRTAVVAARTDCGQILPSRRRAPARATPLRAGGNSPRAGASPGWR